MSENDNHILFNFTYLALRLLGRGLYSNPWSAITELVANGIDAGAEKIRVLFDLTDKAHASIEIMDDGSGMDFNDLSTKYALIGKNKRNDSSLTEEQKNSFMGRKGIGKLAALYLSKKYYIFTKTLESSETIWCLNSENVDDSDIPRLDKVSRNEVGIKTSKYWDEQKKGTLILLTNVNMVGIGEQRMNAFSTRLANYYLLDELKSAIELCVLESTTDPIVFHPVEKSIAFKNMYAFFNNVDSSINEKISERVYVPSQLQQLNNNTYPVRVLSPTDFKCSGYEYFADSKGNIKDLRYDLVGWIGIHSSIKKSDASRNDDAFIKNNIYKPSQLRLYVRKKLAIENLLDYLGVTQAFANYIEGEISFDVLDANELEDIATSNRQGFAEDDERFLLLKKLARKIVTALIKERVDIGKQIGEEEKRIKEEEEKKKQEEIEKAKMALEAEKEEKEKEKKARIFAESKTAEAERTVKELREDLGSEKQRNVFLSDALSTDQKAFEEKLHMFKLNVESMASKIETLVIKNEKNQLSKADFVDGLKCFSDLNLRMSAGLHYAGVALFNTKEESIKGDILKYFQEYCDNMASHYKERIEIRSKLNGTKTLEFNPVEIAMIVDNVISNSRKAGASLLLVDLSTNEEGEAVIDFIDNGTGLSRTAKNINDIFLFGKRFKTMEPGSGVGLYHIKDLVERKLHGIVRVANVVTDSDGTIIDYGSGFDLQIRI